MFKVNIHATTAIYTQKRLHFDPELILQVESLKVLCTVHVAFIWSRIFMGSAKQRTVLTERESYLGIWSQRQVFFFFQKQEEYAHFRRGVRYKIIPTAVSRLLIYFLFNISTWYIVQSSQMKAIIYYTKNEVHGLACILLDEDGICRPWVLYQHPDLLYQWMCDKWSNA